MLVNEHILDLMPCGVILLDHQGVIGYANEWILRTTGKQHDSVYGKELGFVFPEFDLTPNDDPADGSDYHRCFINALMGIRMPVFIARRRIDPHSGAGYRTTLCIMPSPMLKLLDDANASASGERERFSGLIGKSPRMQEVYNFIEMAAGTDANVVIQGESGTGKELVASAIHQRSQRSEREFVRVNCASLTETLLESELFGHAKGAFTGAYRDHVGKFEFAHQGTIFLDEIGEISPAMQAKLLRVLQERVVVRVGDNREIKVNVRVIVATNRNLRGLVSKGKFREDLFYRFNVFPIHMPPLRERGTDVPLLIRHFIEAFQQRTGKHIASCSSDAMRILMAYCWPGNVRELENAVEHAFVLCREEEIQVVDLPMELRVAAVREGICAERAAGIVEQTILLSPMQMHNPGGRRAISREALEKELARHAGNKAATARALGISKVGLWKKMKKMEMM